MQYANLIFIHFKLDLEKSSEELFKEAQGLFQLGLVSDDDSQRIQDAYSDLHLKAIRR